MAKQTSYERVRKLLQWMLDHNQEDTRVTLGCKTCKETHNLLASTALVAWMGIHEASHDFWIKNPFRR